MIQRWFGQNLNKVNLDRNERVASLGGGAMLLLIGLLRLPLTAVLMIASGVYLLLRGVKGHCNIYEMLGIDRTVKRPSANAKFSQELPSSAHFDRIDEAAWESFPTSDPPSWTLGLPDE